MSKKVQIHVFKKDHPYYEQERDLRNRVLLRPIGIPDYGWEHQDDEAFHILALSNGRVIGCVLMAPLDIEGMRCQLMQMAVENDQQGMGIGKSLIEAFIEHAKATGFRVIEIHARQDVIGFYEQFGFLVVGKPFEEVGVAHRHMHLIISPANHP